MAQTNTGVFTSFDTVEIILKAMEQVGIFVVDLVNIFVAKEAVFLLKNWHES